MAGNGGTAAGSLPLTAPLPLARAGAFALASVSFALVAHSTTSHSLPPLWMVALSVAVVAATAHPIAALEHRLPSLAGGLIATQLILHAVFQLQATGRAAAGAAGWLCCGSDPVTATAMPDAHTESAFGRAALVQLGVHILAALVIAAALRLRERSVWTLARAAAISSGAALSQLVAALITITVTVLPVTTRLLVRRASPTATFQRRCGACCSTRVPRGMDRRRARSPSASPDTARRPPHRTALTHRSRSCAGPPNL